MRGKTGREADIKNGGGSMCHKQALPLFLGKASGRKIQPEDIICFRRGLDLVGLVTDKVLFLSEYVSSLKFPSPQGDSGKKRMLQTNYDAFISTMAELMKKYART